MLELQRGIAKWAEGFLASGTRHQCILLRIAAALILYVEPRGLGRVLQAPCSVVLSRGSAIRPDIVFVASGRSALIGNMSLRGSPDLIIEILSPDTWEQDTRMKRDLYSRFGVREYWMVDPVFEWAEVLAWSEWGYATAGIYRKTDRLSSIVLPGFRMPLWKVFAK